MGNIGLEWRLALRRLGSRPGYSLSIVLILALCLGAHPVAV